MILKWCRINCTMPSLRRVTPRPIECLWKNIANGGNKNNDSCSTAHSMQLYFFQHGRRTETARVAYYIIYCPSWNDVSHCLRWKNILSENDVIATVVWISQRIQNFNNEYYSSTRSFKLSGWRRLEPLLKWCKLRIREVDFLIRRIIRKVNQSNWQEG